MSSNFSVSQWLSESDEVENYEVLVYRDPKDAIDGGGGGGGGRGHSALSDDATLSSNVNAQEGQPFTGFTSS